MWPKKGGGEQSWRTRSPLGTRVSYERRDSVRPLESPEENITFQKTLRNAKIRKIIWKNCHFTAQTLICARLIWKVPLTPIIMRIPCPGYQAAVLAVRSPKHVHLQLHLCSSTQHSGVAVLIETWNLQMWMLYHKHHHVLPKFPQILTSVCREGDTDVCKELYVQGIDTAQNSIPSQGHCRAELENLTTRF